MASSTVRGPKRRLIGWVGCKGYDLLYREGDGLEPGLGPDGDHWEEWRHHLLPNLHSLFAWFDGYAKYSLRQNEYAGTIPETPETVEEILWDNGLIRNPLSALKTDPIGNTEASSWMYREKRTVDRQIHVMLFQMDASQDIETDLYAHEEYSAGHPDPEIAVKHYYGEEYNPAAGVQWVQDNLPVEQRNRDY